MMGVPFGYFNDDSNSHQILLKREPFEVEIDETGSWKEHPWVLEEMVR